MNITWLLENTEISGTTRSILALADEMIARGHDVRIVTPGLPLTWRPSAAEWIYVDELSQYHASGDEFVVDRFFGPIVDDEVYRQATPHEHEPPRVLLAGPAHEESRRIDDGYGAIAHARWFHQKLELIRVSPWAPSREEPLDDVQEFHVALSTAEMTRLMHSCDIVLVPGQAPSLTAMEAMAAGIPIIRGERNAVELGERLIEVLDDSDLRDRLRERGREAAVQWRASVVADRFEKKG